jgi:uncharacterized membrane protein YhiD involved in acid resistance
MSYSLKCAAILLALGLVAAGAWAVQPPGDPGAGIAQTMPPSPPASEEAELMQAVISLPVAAALGAALAFRPQRRGTPPRDPAVIQTQIILALVGALVMLVVGASLARAFGIVGAASLVRYRSKIDDPKDAGVMLSCLAIGLAAGVGIYWIAALSTLFILAVVWVLESQEPEGVKDFLLKLKGKDSGRLKDGLEKMLGKNNVKYELRTSSQDDLVYSVRLPLTKRTDRLTNAILELGERDDLSVEWSDKKPGKEAA